MLYHCILKPPVIDIFNCEGRDDEVNEYIVSPVGLVLRVAGPESFILKETDVQNAYASRAAQAGLWRTRDFCDVGARVDRG